MFTVYQLSVMAKPESCEDVLHVKSDDSNDEQIYFDEKFFKEKNNTQFRVLLTSKKLSLKPDDSNKDQTLLLQDIIGCKCMRRKRRRTGGGFSVCSSFVSRPSLKVVDEDSGDRDEYDTSAYLDIYAYNLKHSRRKPERQKTTIILQFKSYDKYEDNYREAHRWRNTIHCLIANKPITNVISQNDKKFLILLNPKSGSGKAVKLFRNKVSSILKEAEIPYNLQVTENAKFARNYIRDMENTAWRGIIAVGGDGVLFEVLNGMFERLDWEMTLADVPLGIIPCGSGNGLARTICHHYQEPYITHDLTGLSMALVRGKTANLDVVRVETKSKIMFSFLSVGWGLLADIDIESEKLRVMGGQRFVFGAITRLIGLRTYKGTISYLRINDVSNLPKPRLPPNITHSMSYDGELNSPVSEVFKDCSEGSVMSKRVDSWHSIYSRPSNASFTSRDPELFSVNSGRSETRSSAQVCTHGPASQLPSLMSPLPSNWEREEGEFVMAYVSYQTYIGEDLLFAPRSQLCDGVMWLLIMKAGISRSQIFTFLTRMSQGSHSEINSEYIKMIPVSAFRLVPEGKRDNGNITVDGELVEYGPIQAEIFPNIVKLLVPNNV